MTTVVQPRAVPPMKNPKKSVEQKTTNQLLRDMKGIDDDAPLVLRKCNVEAPHEPVVQKKPKGRRRNLPFLLKFPGN